MKNFGKGGIWEDHSYCNNAAEEITVEDVGDSLHKWLPDPKELVEWTIAIRKKRKGES
jgi:hypothetical protein